MIHYPYIYISHITDASTGELYQCFYDFSDNTYFGIPDQIMYDKQNLNDGNQKQGITVRNYFLEGIVGRLFLSIICFLLSRFLSHSALTIVFIIELLCIPLEFYFQIEKNRKQMSKYKSLSIHLSNDVSIIKHHYLDSFKDRFKVLLLIIVLIIGIIEYTCLFLSAGSTLIIVVILPVAWFFSVVAVYSPPFNIYRLLKMFMKNQE